MEEEFYKFVNPAEIAKDLNLPKELATKIHKYWALKRKVLNERTNEWIKLAFHLIEVKIGRKFFHCLAMYRKSPQVIPILMIYSKSLLLHFSKINESSCISIRVQEVRGFFFRFFSLFRGLFRQLANKLASPFVHQAQVCTEVDSLNLRRLAIQFHQS